MKTVSIFYGTVCIILDNGQLIKIDINTELGKGKFSLVVSALAADKKLKVYRNDGDLVGGCNTGATIRLHSAVIVIR